MIIKLFSVYDSKAKAYMTPFCRPATGLAIRDFIDVVNDVKSTISRYPEDFSLFEIGFFDDNTGELDMVERPINLGLGSAFVKIQPIASAPMLPGLEIVPNGGR